MHWTSSVVGATSSLRPCRLISSSECIASKSGFNSTINARRRPPRFVSRLSRSLIRRRCRGVVVTTRGSQWMKLIELQVRNFGPYHGAHVLKFNEARPFLLVHGENMRGKTMLINAIRWVMYQRAIDRFGEAIPIVNL